MVGERPVRLRSGWTAQAKAIRRKPCALLKARGLEREVWRVGKEGVVHTCGPVTTVAKEMWEALEGALEGATGEVLTRRYPRTLKLNHTLHDRLIRTESRLFILPTPLETSVTLEIEKLGGRARAVFSTCKVDRNLQVIPLWRVKLASGNRHRRFTKTLSGVRGRFLSVYVESESAGHELEYTLTLREV